MEKLHPGVLVGAVAAGLVSFAVLFVPEWGWPWGWALFQWVIWGVLAGILALVALVVLLLTQRRKD